MLELYWGSGSPFAWRVMLALEIKKIPYAPHRLEFSKKQHKAPEFLALNPRGKVPVIRDGDFVLSESLAILAYLDRKVPEPPLFGRTAAETGQVWRSVSETINYLEPAADRIVDPVFSGKTAEEAEEIKVALPHLHDELRRVEAQLNRSSWLAGDAISAADLVAYPAIETLMRAAGKDAVRAFNLGLLPLERNHPAIAAWRGRITALPGYDRTYPPHWRTAA
jgi:glutathione S-transferase